MAIDEYLIDKRILERSLQEGRVEPFEYEELLENLPDVSDNIVQPEDSPAQAPQPPKEEGR